MEEEDNSTSAGIENYDSDFAAINRHDKEHGTTVFILGAGCSVGSGYPVMRQFMAKARSLRKQSRKQPIENSYRHTLDFRDSYLRVSYIIDRWWDNIEDLFTQVHLQKLLGIRGADERYQHLQRVIWDVYRQKITASDDGYSFFASAIQIWAQANRDYKANRPVIVTTNYDVALESFILGSRSDNTGNVGYAGIATPKDKFFPMRRFLESAKRTVEVVKLHGSVNWFENGAMTDFHTAHSYKQGWAEFHFQCTEKTQRPLIVPPQLGKSDLVPEIQLNWRRAVDVIRHAHEVVVVGYSFPETDLFMSRLLSEGVKENQGIESLTIVNNERDERWWARVKSLFSDSWWENCTHKYRIPFVRFAAAIHNQLNQAYVKGCNGALLADSAINANSETWGVIERLD